MAASIHEIGSKSPASGVRYTIVSMNRQPSPPPVPTEPIFSEISPRYDLLNRLLSLGLDRSWRHRLLDRVGKRSHVLDLACGTGDVALAWKEKGVTVTGMDPSLPMLLLAKRKGITGLVCGQAEALPFQDKTFDGATVAFGIRNFSGLTDHFSEVHRVLDQGGVYGILEFSLPTNPLWRTCFHIYRRLIPWVGWVIARSRAAYEHLATSIGVFAREDLPSHLREADFSDPEVYTVLGGIAAVTTARKGEDHGETA